MAECDHCGRWRPIHARKLCRPCYHKFLRLGQHTDFPTVAQRTLDDGYVWRWYCDGCGQRSFATFSSLEDARYWQGVHERSCRCPRRVTRAGTARTGWWPA